MRFSLPTLPPSSPFDITLLPLSPLSLTLFLLFDLQLSSLLLHLQQLSTFPSLPSPTLPPCFFSFDVTLLTLSSLGPSLISLPPSTSLFSQLQCSRHCIDHLHNQPRLQTKHLPLPSVLQQLFTTRRSLDTAAHTNMVIIMSLTLPSSLPSSPTLPSPFPSPPFLPHSPLLQPSTPSITPPLTLLYKTHCNGCSCGHTWSKAGKM